MDESRDDILTDAGLTSDQDLRAALRDARRNLQHASERGAVPHDNRRFGVNSSFVTLKQSHPLAFA